MTAMHLLVLERDPVRREALLGMLRAAGHQAVTAADAAGAAAALGAPGFDTLVLDLHLPDLDVSRLREALVPSEPVAPEPLDAAERRHIALMLRHTGGNKRQAALLLGISRSTLLHKVRKYGLAPMLLVATAACLFRPALLEAQLEPVPALGIRGVTRGVEPTGHERRDGERLRVHGDSPLMPTDFEIGRLPRMLGMLKMDPHIEVHVDMTFDPS